jgi:RNA polymerase sigma factor (sigma-70 family)
VAKSAAAGLRQTIRSVERLVDPSTVSDQELLRRFAQENDQAAFTAVVRRYSGMVLGVCRRTLGNVQDAEDACQATFLVLARKAPAGRWRHSVANYLYTTARRIASNARLAAQRRARREGTAVVPQIVDPADQMTGRELLAALDEEMDKLPPRYRDPLMLCYLEGLTREEVAARLGVPAATVKTQLERGRKKLGDALTKRGCGLGAGLLALAVTSQARASSPRLVEAILASVSGSPPAAVAALAREASVNTLGHRMVVALALVVVLGVGMAVLKLPAASQKAAAVPLVRVKGAAPPTRGMKGDLSVRVLNPAGKPVAGAEVVLLSQEKAPQKLGVTAADGRLRVAIPSKRQSLVLLARAPGLGADFIDLGRAPPGEIALRLVKDQPIRGRVISTEGKPVPGVTVAVTHVVVYKDHSLDPFLEARKPKMPLSPPPSGVKHVWHEGAFPATTTGQDGRFTITGTGAERLVVLRLRGAGVAAQEVWVANRAGFDARPYNKAPDNARMQGGFGIQRRLEGPDLVLVAEREKLIRGVVTDQGSGKPMPGVKVTLLLDGGRPLAIPLSATSDARGRYEIHGARKAKEYIVDVDSNPASGHLPCRARTTDTPGYGAVNLDLAVMKGVVITGRVIDRSTNKLLPGIVMVTVLADNPFVKEFPTVPYWGKTEIAADGKFRIVSVPGPVILMGGPDTRGMPEGQLGRYRYKLPVPDPKYPKYFSTKAGYEGSFLSLGGNLVPLQGNFCKVLVLKPGSDVVKQDILLEPSGAPPRKLVDWGRLDQ